MVTGSSQYGDCMTEAMTELALFEELALERRVDAFGSVRYCNALGQLHRVCGPAVEYTDGTYMWYQNGQRHRADAPAVESADGKFWYQNGQRHRIGGPAVEHSDGSLKYYLHGNEYPETSYWRIMALKNIYP